MESSSLAAPISKIPDLPATRSIDSYNVRIKQLATGALKVSATEQSTGTTYKVKPPLDVSPEKIVRLFQEATLIYSKNGKPLRLELPSKLPKAKTVNLDPVTQEEDIELDGPSLSELTDNMDESSIVQPSFVIPLALAIHRTPLKELKRSSILPQLVKNLMEKLNDSFPMDGAVPDNVICELKALAYVLNAMVWANIKKLPKEDVYKPLREKLQKRATDNNQEIAYHAKYAYEALKRIGDDETKLQKAGKLALNTSVFVLRMGLAIYRGSLDGVLEALKKVNDPIQALLDIYDIAKENSDDIKDVISDARDIFEQGSGFYEKTSVNSSKEEAQISSALSTQDQKIKKTISQQKWNWYACARFIEGILFPPGKTLKNPLDRLTVLRAFLSCSYEKGILDPCAQRHLIEHLHYFITEVKRPAVQKEALQILARIYHYDQYSSRPLGPQHFGNKLSKMCFFHKPTIDLNLYLKKTVIQHLQFYELYYEGKSSVQAKELLEEIKRAASEEENAWIDKNLIFLEKASFKKPIADRLDFLNQFQKESSSFPLHLTYVLDKKISFWTTVQKWNCLLDKDELPGQKRLYIPLKTTAVLKEIDRQKSSKDFHPKEKRLSLLKQVRSFLASDKKVFFLQGNAGSGKTFFSKILVSRLLKEDLAEGGTIPVYIWLASSSIKDPMKHLIEEMLLVVKGYSKEDLKKLPLLLVLDGYDELQTYRNILWDNDIFGRLPLAKIIITCRSEALRSEDVFIPTKESKPQSHLIESFVIKPFNDQQRNRCIEQYSRKHLGGWTKERYLETISKIQGLKELVNNPYMLTIALEALPDIFKNKPFENTTLGQFDLYERYAKIRWEKTMVQLYISSSQEAPKKAHNRTVLFDYHGRFAAEMERQGPEEAFVYKSEETSFWSSILNNEDRNEILRQSGLLLVREEEKRCYYRFPHKSMQDFFAAYHLLDKLRTLSHAELSDTLLSHQPLTPLILHFIAEKIRGNEVVIKKLFDLIETTKNPEVKVTDKKALAAGNAATLLNYAEISLENQDWEGIKISGADLYKEYRPQSQWTPNSSYLRNINLKNAYLLDVKFAEDEHSVGISWSNMQLEGASLSNVLWGMQSFKIDSEKDWDELDWILMRVDNWNMHIKGQYLSSKIGKHRHLKNLVISSTKQEIPKEIKQLTQLRFLYLYMAQLKNLPKEIGELVALESLTLYTNGMFEEIPAEIGQLKSLKQLVLSAKQLKNLPKEIGQLTELEILNLSHTMLEEISKEIWQLKHLKQLHFSSTKVKNLPKQIGQLVQLEVFDLSHTMIEDIPKEIGQLEKLQKFNLKGTRVKKIPKEVGELVQLRVLDLRNTMIQNFPTEINQLKHTGNGLYEKVV